MNRRARSLGGDRVRFDLLAYQTMNNVKAMITHHCRTGADITSWFGNHKPTAKYKPQTA